MSDQKTVLVAGATGKQGGAVVNALLKNGQKVRALTRNAESPSARRLRDQGVEIVVGDLTDLESLLGALQDVDTVFTMSTSFQTGHENEVTQGITMTDAAIAAGVGHLIFSSVASANRNTGIPHFETKSKIEEYVASSAVPYTIIGPTAFMENLIQPPALPNLRQGKISRALPAARKVQQIAVADIGAFAAAVIERGESLYRKRIDIAGDDLTGEEIAAILSRVSGKKIRYEMFPPSVLRATNPDLAIMLEWQQENNYTADIDALRQDFPEVKWHTFEQWTREQDWKTLLA
jgi:uncharacterized protein YbjT (DUF2867 family)